VYKLDRLSRSQKDTLYLIEEKFLPNNVDFVSLSENFDTTTPLGRAMIGILSVFAQLERENIKERLTLGRTERAKEGLYNGQGRTPIGYEYVDNRLIINEYEALQVKKIFELYIKGWGYQKILNYLVDKGYTTRYGNWLNSSVHTFYRMVQNRVYIGEVAFSGKYYNGQHKPIISKEIFEKANMLYEKRKGKKRDAKYFLSGVLYCGKCGERFIIETSGERSYYVCKNRKHGYKNTFKCDNKIWRTNDIETIIEEKIHNMVLNQDIISKIASLNVAKNEQIDKSVIENRIISIDKQIEKLMDLYQMDKIPIEVISAKIQKLYDEKKALEEQLKEEPAQDDSAIEVYEILKHLENFDEVWESLGVQQKKDICKSIFNKIVANGEVVGC